MSQPPDEQSLPPPISSDREALQIVDLDTILPCHSSRGKRMVPLSLLMATLVAVILTFWNIVPKATPGSPTPSRPTPFPNALSIVSNVNFGTITVDGKEQPNPLPSTIRLGGGKSPSMITLKAPPFRPLSCPFPIPSPGTPWGGVIGYINGYSPCVAGTGFTLQKQNVSNLEMLFTLADLPKDQQQQITALIPEEVAAQQTITVPAQSPFVTGVTSNGQVSTSHLTGPLQASAFLVPTRQNSQEVPSCQGFICTDSGGFLLGGSLSGQFWEVTTPVALRWRITQPGGTVVSDVTFPFASMLTLYLTYSESTGWQLGLISPEQLRQVLNQVVCETGAELLGGDAQHFSDQLYWGVISLHDRGVKGCELSLQLNSQDQGHFVWRFGALLAADAKAHLTLPLLPMASPADLAAVGG
jgi:hypothetical protein